MDYIAILAAVQKAITILSALFAAGQAAAPAVKVIIDHVTALLNGAQQGTVTQQQIDDMHALLDQQMAQFNADLPPV